MRNFEDNTLRVQASSRGGGIEVTLDNFGYPNVRMTGNLPHLRQHKIDQHQRIKN